MNILFLLEKQLYPWRFHCDGEIQWCVMNDLQDQVTHISSVLNDGAYQGPLVTATHSVVLL